MLALLNLKNLRSLKVAWRTSVVLLTERNGRFTKAQGILLVVFAMWIAANIERLPFAVLGCLIVGGLSLVFKMIQEIALKRKVRDFGSPEIEEVFNLLPVPDSGSDRAMTKKYGFTTYALAVVTIPVILVWATLAEGSYQLKMRRKAKL